MPRLALDPNAIWEMPKQPTGCATYAAHGELAPPALADLRDWTRADVGWGLVLPDTDELPAKAKARGDEAAEPLRETFSRPETTPPCVGAQDCGTGICSATIPMAGAISWGRAHLATGRASAKSRDIC